MTNQSETPESDLPIEQQGLPTSPLESDQPGRSFGGDEPETGEEGSFGTKSDDADPEDADAARAAEEEEQSEVRAHESVTEDQQSYGTDPTAADAPPADVEQPIQNPDSPLGRQLS